MTGRHERFILGVALTEREYNAQPKTTNYRGVQRSSRGSNDPGSDDLRRGEPLVMAKLDLLVTKRQKLLAKRDQISDMSKAVRSELEQVNQDLMDTMLKKGELSVRKADFTISILEKPTIVIEHEPTVIDFLEHDPNIDIRTLMRLDKAQFNEVAKHLAEATGELIPGTRVEKTQYVTVKPNKKEGDNAA